MPIQMSKLEEAWMEILYNLWIFTSLDQKDLLDFEVQIIQSQLHTPLFSHTKNSFLKYEKAIVFHTSPVQICIRFFFCNTFRGAGLHKSGKPPCLP